MSLSDNPGLVSKRIEPEVYIHDRYRLRRQFCRFLLKTIAFTILVKLEPTEGLENFPRKGPAVILINHIAFVDPIVVLYICPRDIVPLAKIEVYNYPVIGVFPHLWGVIPVRREEVDRRAIRQALNVLDAGEFVLVAPEGHRYPQLQRGKEGFAYLASRSGAPIVPVAVQGTPGFPSLPYNQRWRQPGARVRVGRPFTFHPGLIKAGRDELRQMADEAMYILAEMLPENLRGVYADLSKATQNTIEWV